MRKSYNQRNAKVDANQADIVKALRKIGAKVKPVHSVKKFCDIIVGYKGKLYMMEIKSDDKLPNYYKNLDSDKKREHLEGMLSEGEKECMNKFQSVGVTYYIVSSIEEAINILNNY